MTGEPSVKECDFAWNWELGGGRDGGRMYTWKFGFGKSATNMTHPPRAGAKKKKTKKKKKKKKKNKRKKKKKKRKKPRKKFESWSALITGKNTRRWGQWNQVKDSRVHKRKKSWKAA